MIQDDRGSLLTKVILYHRFYRADARHEISCQLVWQLMNGMAEIEAKMISCKFDENILLFRVTIQECVRDEKEMQEIRF